MKLSFHIAPVLFLLATGACGRVGPVAGGPVPTPVTAAPKPVAAPVTSPAATVDRATLDEVVKTVVAVFGDSAVLRAADSAPAADDPIWDIDVRSYETHDRVEHYVGLFSHSAKERFLARLSRGTRYEPMIRAKLRARGMPEDLTYLALIESGYDPHAYSRAAAVGMWQFMSGTARGVGMRVDWWMDERRDPARSTDGAIRFLASLQKQFGSLYLAAAAYNGGPGRVARGLTRFAGEMDGAEGEDRFFALAEQDYLRSETKNYVPQIIAAALVAKMPARYGLVIDSLPQYGYDSVLAAPGTSLAHIAAASGATKAEMRDLNPAVLRGITPPDASIWARVPTGSAVRTRVALDNVPAGSLRGFSVSSVSGSTTTPTAFAEKHGVTIKQLRWFNPTIRTGRKGRLVAGQSLRIPTDLAIDFAREIPDPAIERYGGSSTVTLTSRGIHVVKRGESLGAVAKRYGTTVTRLKALNGIKGTRLIAGQTLRVRSGTTTVTSKASGAKKSKVKKPVAKKKTAHSKKKAPSRK